MTTIDFQRRQQLLAKYPAMTNEWPMSPSVNTQVRAIDRAEALIATAWPRAGQVAKILFNPALMPDLAERAEATAAEFYTRCGEFGDLRFDTHDTEYDPHAAHEQGVVRVWAVGTSHVDIIRDRWHDHPNRKSKPVEYFAGMYTIGLPDFFDCRRYGCDGNCDLACTVRLARTCGGPTGVMPVNLGTLLLLFRCCRECEALAGKFASNNHKTAVINARADIPPGAVII